MEKQSEIDIAMKNAWSIEAKPVETGPVEYIGKAQGRDRIYLLYKDKLGNYWHKTVFKTAEGYISEYEHIFRKKKRRKNEPSHINGKVDKGPRNQIFPGRALHGDC